MSGEPKPQPTPWARATPSLKPPPLNKYTQLLHDRPLDLFRKYSVTPPDGAVGDSVVDFLGSARRNRVMPVGTRSQIVMDGMFTRFFQPGTLGGGEGFSQATVNKPIAWINLVKDTVRMHQALTFEAIIPSGKDTIPKAHVPVWFLPWESRHLIDITIPPRQNDDDDDPDDPKIFFTAAINGCSVFVRGDPRSPTVYHAGISQGQTPYGHNPSAFWRDLLDASLAGNQIYTGRTKEVNNTDYINQTGVSGGAQTANATLYENWLKSLSTNPFTVTRVIPWGSVFGIRYGSLWSFYLQENATVQRYKVVADYSTPDVTTTKKTMMGLRNKQVTQQVHVRKMVMKLESSTNWPIVVRDFFPGAGSYANFVERWQT